MHTATWEMTVGIFGAAFTYSGTPSTLADPAAAPSSAPDDLPMQLDSLGRPLACDKFLQAGAWRPNRQKTTLVSVHITRQGELRNPVVHT